MEHALPDVQQLRYFIVGRHVVGKLSDVHPIRATALHMLFDGFANSTGAHHRKRQYRYDEYAYGERHLVECFFSEAKQFRRVFSRFDKLADTYLNFLHIAGTLIWLK